MPKYEHFIKQNYRTKHYVKKDTTTYKFISFKYKNYTNDEFYISLTSCKNTVSLK